MKKQFEHKEANKRSGSPKERCVTVKESNTLLPFLLETLSEQSRTSIKGLLGHGQISVNGQVTRQFDTSLRPGDTVGIYYGKRREEWNNPLLKILWEDDDLIERGKLFVKLLAACCRQENATGVYTSGVVFQPEFYEGLATRVWDCGQWTTRV